MTFTEFLQTRNVTDSPRGAFIAEAKTLINAGVFPQVNAWPELYRFLIRRHASTETISLVRQLWRKFESVGVPA
ncbi:hypothetical protein ABIB06_002437 [Bradyrhizobium sp. LB8.2]